jgi:hypothetical protein
MSGPEFFMKRPETFLWPVTYSMPDEAGKLHAFEFRGRFRYMDVDQIRAEAESGVSDADFIRKVFVGFVDIQAPDGTDQPDTPENLAALLNLPGMLLAIQAAHTRALIGFARKN